MKDIEVIRTLAPVNITGEKENTHNYYGKPYMWTCMVQINIIRLIMQLVYGMQISHLVRVTAWKLYTESNHRSLELLRSYIELCSNSAEVGERNDRRYSNRRKSQKDA